MKIYISKGTGINRLSGKVKANLETGKVIRGQFNENRILIIEGEKYWEKQEVSEFHADVFFIFNFPQRKITKALKDL